MLYYETQTPRSSRMIDLGSPWVRVNPFLVWSFVVMFLVCRMLCGVVRVVCLCMWHVSLLTKWWREKVGSGFTLVS